MNDLQVFTNEKLGSIRTIKINGEPYFVGKDITETLGYTNPTKAMRDHVDVDDMTFNDSLKLSRQSGAWLINESGVYALIFGSKLESAKEFKHWVTHEVLPSIRETGFYNMVSENSNAVLVTITPDMAAHMLENNVGNRKLNQAAVNRMATDMLMGNYVVNGTSIKLYKDGTLCDGQHRLTACVKANVPFTTYIIRNLDKNVLPTIDCGRPRSLVDTLNMTGCTIQKKLVPAMNVYFGKGYKLTSNQAKILWNTYEDKFLMLCDVLAGAHHDYILSQSSLRAYLIHLALSEKWNEADIRTFVTGIKDKPNRATAFEMSCYNFRGFYNRKIHNKLYDTKASGERTKCNVTIDALCTLATGINSDKVVKSFAWKNQAKNVLDTGYNLAREEFIAIAASKQKLIKEGE